MDPKFQGGIWPVLEEKVNDLIASIFVVEEDVERPVHDPRSLLQLLQNWGKGIGVYEFTQFAQILNGRLPPLHQYFWSQLSPQCTHTLLTAGGQCPVRHKQDLKAKLQVLIGRWFSSERKILRGYPSIQGAKLTCGKPVTNFIVKDCTPSTEGQRGVARLRDV